jgi:hypothetical protein
MSIDPRRLNADLHCHSTRSDGLLEPAELARRAHANGVELFALTDHDELGGLAEASGEAAALGMRFIPGVEISVTWAGETVHVLGLGIDPGNRVLRDGLARTRAGRRARALQMAEQLEAAGVPDAFDGALRHVGNPELISRTHFARHIVACGVCEDVDEVFGRFLVEGRPGFVADRTGRGRRGARASGALQAERQRPLVADGRIPRRGRRGHRGGLRQPHARALRRLRPPRRGIRLSRFAWLGLPRARRGSFRPRAAAAPAGVGGAAVAGLALTGRPWMHDTTQ